MKIWRCAVRDAAISGSIASLASSLALAACGKCEDGRPLGPTNAISHWFWGERTVWQDGPSLRYTATGYLIHHASSVFWAVLHEKWFGQLAERREFVSAGAGAATVAGLACLTDYMLTPPRLRPGFEKRLSHTSLCLVYGSFGFGLLLGALITARYGKRTGALNAPDCLRT
jgi:hypothetical protein